MNIIEVYDVHTKRGLHGVVEIYQDVDQGDFVAEFNLGETVRVKEPGQNITRLNMQIPDTLRDNDKVKLIEKCKKELTKDGDKIKYCEKRSDL